MEEVWKPYPGNPGYIVSNTGRVASVMAAHPHKNSGYNAVTMSYGEKKGQKGKGRLPKKRMLVHRMVLETFVGPGDDKIGRHLDDDRTNNHLDNLAWGDKRDNAEDARRNGRMALGERIGTAKIDASAAADIRARYEAGEHYAEIAEDHGVSPSHVIGIGKGRFWKHLLETED